MKILSTLSLLFIATLTYGQSVTDSIKVYYYKESRHAMAPPGYFINEKLMPMVPLINPESIQDVKIEKGSYVANDKTYYGKVLVTTKPGVEFNFISLLDLKDKYTNIKNQPAIFMVDNKVIKDNHKEYMVDEKDSILSLTIDYIELDGKRIPLIKVLSKTKENIKKSNEILIRGSE